MTQTAPATAPAQLPAPRPAPRKAARRRLRIRLLPALMFVSVLMVGVRVGDLWEGVTGTGPEAARSLLAAEARSDEPMDSQMAEAATGDGMMAEATASDGAEMGSETIDQPFGLPAFDPEDLSAGEWDLLQQLSARRDALDQRERDLDQREALLAVAEQRVDEKVAELEAVRGQIEELLGQVDEEGEAQLLGLVSIYESMRPADAATIFNGLDLEVLISVLERMRGTKSAAILAGMNPERARLVTTELARRRDLPELPD